MFCRKAWTFSLGMEQPKKHKGEGVKKNITFKRRHVDTTTPRSAAVVHEDDFYQYVNFRILDSIGYPGAYRKFMIRRRDQGAEWAVKMNDHVVMVQHAVKELAFLEQDMKNSMVLKNLDIVWQHVVESNTPPSDMHLSIGTCLITGKTNVSCIVIRGKGRGAHNFTVGCWILPSA
jgi:hypothetical protein